MYVCKYVCVYFIRHPVKLIKQPKKNICAFPNPPCFSKAKKKEKKLEMTAAGINSCATNYHACTVSKRYHASVDDWRDYRFDYFPSNLIFISLYICW